jgi:chorismate mutase
MSESLQDFRRSIDNIDAALVHLLAERFKITKRVGAHKAAMGLPTRPTSIRTSPRNSCASSSTR